MFPSFKKKKFLFVLLTITVLAILFLIAGIRWNGKDGVTIVGPPGSADKQVMTSMIFWRPPFFTSCEKIFLQRKKVFLIGIDGADLPYMRSLMQRGKLRNMAGLIGSGAAGEIETVKPIISPIIWTSIATGMPPLKHGILDFLSVDPASGEKIPVNSGDRKVPALWTIFSVLGVRSGVVGWWVTTPAEKIEGYMVSDSLVSALFGSQERNAGHTTVPEEEESAVKGMIRDFHSVTHDEVRKFINISEDEYRKAMSGPREGKFNIPVKGLASIIASTESIHRINLYLYDKYKPDFNAVYYEGVDLVSHLFMAYAPPRREHIAEEDFERYRDAVENFYECMDSLIGDYIKRMGSDTFLIIVSDHGFKTGDERPYETSSVYTDTASFWHSDKATLIISGADAMALREGNALSGSVYDVAPTILSLFGLPEGSGMGHSLIERSATHESAKRAFDYGRITQPQEALASREVVDEEFLASLKSLGYISSGASSGAGTVPPSAERGPSDADPRSNRTASYYNNRGILLKNEGKIEEAIASFREALGIDPKSSTALYNLSSIHFSRKDYDKAEEYFYRAVVLMPAQEREMEFVRFAVVFEENGQRERSLRVLNRGRKEMPDSYLIHVNLGTVLAKDGRYRQAQELFRKSLSLKPDSPIALNNLALCEYNLGNVGEALGLWEKSLQIDPQQEEIKRNLKSIKK